MLNQRQLEWLRTHSPGFAYAEACKLGADANADDCAQMARGAVPADTPDDAPKSYRPFQLVERGHA